MYNILTNTYRKTFYKKLDNFKLLYIPSNPLIEFYL